MFRLSLAERKRVAEVVVPEANHRLPVFIHVGAMHMDDTLDLARHAHQIGADGIGAVTPSYFGVSDREMEAYYVAVANAVPADFPVYLYKVIRQRSQACRDREDSGPLCECGWIEV